MDNTQAAALIKDVFIHSFDKERFACFSRELLRRMEPKTFSNRGQMVWESFRDHIVSFDRIGKYQDPDGRRMDILAVKLKRGTSLERARALQRNFIAKYLKEGRGGAWKDAALVAFHTEESPDWRFSLVTMETRLDSGRVREDFSPARRLSFLVGENESSHTAQKRLLPLLVDGRPDIRLADLQDAFNIEVVTREFFKKYKELYERLKAALTSVLKEHPNAKKEFETKRIDPAEFAKKLLGQIVFLYFLQKKGWFGVARDAEWGSGPKNFLRDLFDKKYGDYQNFFNDILEPLFYEALAKERDRHYYSRFKCRIPFLNGGLFDAIGDYAWEDVDLLLPDGLFRNKSRTPEGDEGDGVLDVFDRYNFTVCEDEPLEKEVAVDPEMLGKVFENLLDENARHATGTYYTPRAIVHHMCRQALLEYLIGRAKNLIPSKDLDLFLRHGEFLEEHEAMVLEKGRETDAYSHKLPQPIRNRAADLDEWLADLRVCDPAIGSGAFPLGMMSEIVRARRVLARLTQKIGKPGYTPYDFKRHAIQHTLHGVDLAPGAVEIAKLRLWLSLVVDEDDIRNIKPLPNLEYKVMQGNSLFESVEGVQLTVDRLWSPGGNGKSLAVDPMALKALQSEVMALSQGRLTALKKARLKEIQRKLDKLNAAAASPVPEMETLWMGANDAQKAAESLKRLQDEFFETASKSRKEDLRRRIEELEWDLIVAALKSARKPEVLKQLEDHKRDNIRPYFLWRLHFAEVFRENNGFDIVIGNPPYVRQEDIRELKPHLKAEGYQVFSGTADLYVYFYERALQILRPGGVLSFITSNKFFRAAYGATLRAYLAEQSALKEIVDFGDAPVFTAISYPAVVVAVKGGVPAPERAEVRALSWAADTSLEQVDDVVEKRSLLLAQRVFTADGWRIIPPAASRLMEKLKAAGKPLGEYVQGRFYYGIKTGLNEAFVVDRATRDRLIKEHASSKEILKPFLRGRDVKRWRVEFAEQYLIKIESSDNKEHPWSNKSEKEAEKLFSRTYPAIYEHFQSLRKIKLDEPDDHGCRNMFEKLQRRDDTGRFFWELRSCVYWQEFEKPKVILGRFMNSPTFAFDKERYFHNDALYMIPEVEEVLVSILNSNVTWWFLLNTCTDLQNGYLQAYQENLFQIPIPGNLTQIKSDLEKPIAHILKAKRDKPEADVSAFEADLNARVNRLFGLTAQEVKIIEAAGC